MRQSLASLKKTNIRQKLDTGAGSKAPAIEGHKDNDETMIPGRSQRNELQSFIMYNQNAIDAFLSREWYFLIPNYEEARKTTRERQI